MRHDEILGLLHWLLVREDATILWAARWELAFWALVFLLAAVLLLVRTRWIGRAEDRFHRFSEHRVACVCAVAASVIVIRTLLLPLIPVPVPILLDEYSYLVGADTFAAGRITNPPHPMWIHLETINVNMQPTYQTMYPPAQSLVLGLAQRLTGEPWIGVLLSVAVMCGAITWMLQGWMPPPWALLGGLYAVLRFGIFSYWVNSYWGGAVAAIGGAMVLGSLPRLRRKLDWQQGLVFAIGLVILANSRPLEGFLFALPIAVAIVWLIARSRLPRRRLLMQVAIPCLLLTVAAAGMLYYNWRGTGHALLMPYQLNQDIYHVSKPFIFQTRYAIPHYRNPQMRAFYMFHEYGEYLKSRSWWGLQHLVEEKYFCYYTFLVWPLLLLFVPGVILASASAELRVVVLSVALMMLGLTLQLWPAHGHYAAPAVGAILLILLSALRALRTNVEDAPLSADRRPVPASGKYGEYRLWFSRALVLGLSLTMLLPIADRLWNPYMLEESGTVPKQMDRQRILSQLNRTPGEHLVIVHYQQRDIPSIEWVYNRADIDHAKVVWARDMGPEANQELVRYFHNRRIWYVDRNAGAILQPYTYATSSGSCHPADGLPPACEIIAELGLPQPEAHETALANRNSPRMRDTRAAVR